MMFGILREFLIVGLLGFSSSNDHLQLYLSIFYTIGLTIDAMRLACLNLYAALSLPRILFCASVIGLPFSLLIGFTLNYSSGGLNLQMLLVTIFGSYLNLIASLLITYKQRNDRFLAAQFINVLPNFILIPGILLCYWFATTNLIFAIVYLTSLIPVVQCLLLLLLRSPKIEITATNQLSLSTGIMTFARHLSSMISEQFYQILLRTAFFRYGTGYLSIFSFAVRIYSAARFILVDSFIGSKLAAWKIKASNEDNLARLLNFTLISFCMVMFAFALSVKASSNFIFSAVQMSLILLIGFYFSTLVRIIYFKINRHQNSPALVLRFALFEFLCLCLAFLLTKQISYPILTLLWIGYVAKPFGQLLLLRKSYHGLALNYEMNGV